MNKNLNQTIITFLIGLCLQPIGAWAGEVKSSGTTAGSNSEASRYGFIRMGHGDNRCVEIQGDKVISSTSLPKELCLGNALALQNSNSNTPADKADRVSFSVDNYKIDFENPNRGSSLGCYPGNYNTFMIIIQGENGIYSVLRNFPALEENKPATFTAGNSIHLVINDDVRYVDNKASSGGVPTDSSCNFEVVKRAGRLHGTFTCSNMYKSVGNGETDRKPVSATGSFDCLLRN